MWLMLQQQQPDDFVIGTGETTTVRCAPSLTSSPSVSVLGAELGSAVWQHRLCGSCEPCGTSDGRARSSCWRSCAGSLLRLAFARAGIPIRWEGLPGVTETGVLSEGERAGEVVVRINPKYFRPAEVSTLTTPSRAMFTACSRMNRRVQPASECMSCDICAQ